MTKGTVNAPKITVLSPVYGCRDCLEKLAERVTATFEITSLDWELLFVDDRGPDEPWDLICALAEQNPRIRGLRLARNHGQHLAIWAGLEAARGDWVSVIDCDLQDDPTVIPTLYEKAVAEKVDAVIVDRGTWSDSWLRRFASNTFYRVVDLLGGIRLKNSGNFGLYSRQMVDTLVMFREQEVFLPMMVALTGLKNTSHRLDRSDRSAGESSYSFLRLVRLAIAIVIRFSDRPLQLSVLIGMTFSLFSAAISLFLIMAWLFGAFTVPGWTSTILSVWFLSGLIMATLGIHGFYLGRIFGEVKHRPRIIIETTTMEARLVQEEREQELALRS
ncbi:glycosyltransferase family 2 protein [Hwanghaeella sp.]|uniref:glycosyltransferase family 2 protein n=1 Tax=Hwanghaeella sp. TaxID=2605943 RepID=UPI003CCBF6AC